MVLLGLDSGLFSKYLCYALRKAKTINLYRIKRSVECIVDCPSTIFVSWRIARPASVRTFGTAATRRVMGSLTTWISVATRRKIRWSGMVCAAVLGKLWRHKNRLSLLSGCDSSSERDLWGVSSFGKRVSVNRCQWDVLVRRSYKSNMNPVSREIADTNFLETKIYSSKYIKAKT